jgi:hypothetical protein
MSGSIAGHRRRRQGGQQIIEFGLVAILYIPLLMGSFLTGMNMIRSVQASHVARDMADMYILGADFSQPQMQTLVQKLASGMDLQIGAATTNVADNLSTAGRGMIWISKLQWVGTTSQATCTAVLPASCTNTGKFVFAERIRFGNSTLEAERDSIVGHTTATRNTYGIVTSVLATTAAAAIQGTQQTEFTARWQSGPSGTTPLTDGQIVYMVEVYFKSPDLLLGSMSGQKGVYSRWFF